MKNTIKSGLLITTVCIAAFFSSCNNPLALGDRLYLDGPEIKLENPKATQPVDGQFYMNGTVESRYPVQRMHISATKPPSDENGNILNDPFEVEWEYTISNGWRVTWDKGTNWTAVDDLLVTEIKEDNGSIVVQDVIVHPSWGGTDTNVIWELPIDMLLAETKLGNKVEDGQYIFTVLAEDSAGKSGEKSSLKVSVRVDKVSPNAEIILPKLYKKTNYADNDVLERLKDADDWKNPVNLGLFMNGKFDMQYLVKAINDVWSMDIRFYDEADSNWENPDGSLSDSYVYRINFNEADIKPAVPPATEMVRPTGKLTVNMIRAPGFWTEGKAQHELKATVTGKRTFHVAISCMSASGNFIEDAYKSQGYFVYYPDSDKPWIEFPSGLEFSTAITPHKFYPSSVAACRAYDNDGVDEIEYRIYEVNEFTNTIKDPQPEGYPLNERIKGNNSRISSWSFHAPTFSGFFKIVATVYENSKNPDPTLSTEREAWFEVEDATLPEIRVPIKPLHNMPLFNFIEDNGDWFFDIEGEALADSGIASVEMVWINPHSMNYAAMSQLSFFRSPNYTGKKAEPYGWMSLTADGKKPEAGFEGKDPGIDKAFDDNNPNKLWKLEITDAGVDRDSGRKKVIYRKRLYLKEDLNIVPGKPLNEDHAYDYLKSQVFVFKATDINSSEENLKATMLTWAPEGDTEGPRVKISKVKVNDKVLEPRSNDELETFSIGDIVHIKGLWREDSAFITDPVTKEKSLNEDLNILQGILRTNLKIRVGDYELNGDSLESGNYSIKTIRIFDAEDKKADEDGDILYDAEYDGVWEAIAEVGEDDPWILQARRMVDTLVVSAVFTDLGGNISEDGLSWLIRSARLRFIRVGSVTPDDLYTTFYRDETEDDKGNDISGDPVKINIYLEFNKVVQPLNIDYGNKNNLPALELNSGGTAYYDLDHPDQWDKVNNVPILSSRQHFVYEVKAGENTPEAGALNVTKLKGVSDNTYISAGNSYLYLWEERTKTEKVWLTPKDENRDDGIAKLPVADSLAEEGFLFTLRAGKTIKIDTTPPELDYIMASVRGGWYNQGNVLYITMKFKEPVHIANAGDLPRLITNIKNNGNSNLVMPLPDEPPKWSDSYEGDYDEYDFIQESNDSIIFSFPVTLGDTIDNFKELIIKSLTGGDVVDLAGNVYAKPTSYDLSVLDKNGGEIYVHAMTPPTPKVRVYSLDDENAVIGSSIWVWDDDDKKWIKPEEEVGYDEEEYVNDYAEWNPDLYTTYEDFLATPDKANGSIPYIPKARLNNVYAQNLYIELLPAGIGGYDWKTVEYSVDYGRNWTEAHANVRMPRENLGDYVITARQIDEAGNESSWSRPITLNWNQGALLTRISSSKPNGVYTNNIDIGGNRDDEIPIDLNFRINVKFNVNPTIELNVRDYENNASVGETVYVTPNDWKGKTDKVFRFIYPVKGYHSTRDLKLNVVKMWVDESETAGVLDLRELELTDVNDAFVTYVGNMVSIGSVQGNNLENNKDIKIAYGRPLKKPGITIPEPVKDGDGYRTTVEIEFDRDIWTNGSEKIYIKQKSAGYRLPAVVSKAQGDRYRALLPSTFRFNQYYTEGVNGFEAGEGTYGTYGGSPDNTMKYILNFDYDPYTIVANASSARPGTIPGTTTLVADMDKFADAFRTAEAVTISMSSSAVTVPVSTVDKTHRILKIELSGGNALTVLGADFEVVYGAGLVIDQFSNPCLAYNSTIDDSAVRIHTQGIDRAYVRVEKKPEDITLGDNSATEPKFLADWSGTTRVRFDCRTPDSEVKWNAKVNKDEYYPPVTSPNAATNTQMGWTYISNSNYNLPPLFGTESNGSSRPGGGQNGFGSSSANNTRFRNPGVPDDPETTNYPATVTAISDTTDGTWGNVYGTGTPPLVIGDPPTNRVSTNYDFGSLFHGYRWRVRAKGRIGSGTTSDPHQYSAMTEEIAYRSVFTFTGYRINLTGATGNTNYGGENFGPGDQLWLRGGNTLSGSNIYGFPLTTSDNNNWNEIKSQNRRAGIRLMKQTAVGVPPTTTPATPAQLAFSTWQWVTWEMNAMAYVTLFIGRDKDASGGELNTPVNEIKQYGPKRSSFQDGNGNWSFLKEFYSIFPGSHRFMVSSRPDFYNGGESGSHRVGQFCFNNSFYTRPFTSTDVTWPPAP